MGSLQTAWTECVAFCGNQVPALGDRGDCLSTALRCRIQYCAAISDRQSCHCFAADRHVITEHGLRPNWGHRNNLHWNCCKLLVAVSFRY